MSEGDAPLEPLEVPYTALSADALRGVIDSFVLREGTDYGPRDFSLEQKCAQVLDQIKRGEAHILYDPETDSVTIETAGTLRRRPAP